MKRTISLLMALVLMLTLAIPVFASEYFRCNGDAGGREPISYHDYNGGLCTEMLMYSYCTRYENNLAQENRWHNHAHIRYHDTCPVSSQSVCGHSTNHGKWDW